MMNKCKYAAFCLMLSMSCMPILTVHGFDYKSEVVIENLDNPWSIACISNSDWLVTELSGSLRRVVNGELLEEPIAGVPEAFYYGQGGLSDVVLHPNFNKNKYVYLTMSAADTSNKKLNFLKVVRGELHKNELLNVETIFESKPLRKTRAHYGARLAFMKDGSILISSGDGFNHREQAQLLDNHFGKFIRLNDDGSIPKNNPYADNKGYKPEVWSYGHRNQQGLVVTKEGLVIAHEHGPKGGDELNIIQPGKNYGWPAITYGVDYSGAVISPFTEHPDMEQPVKYWVPSIAPSSMVLYSGDMFPSLKNDLLISALKPGDVRQLKFENDEVVSESIIISEFGRIRHIAEAPDGSLLLLTDQRRKKGKLIRISAISEDS